MSYVIDVQRGGEVQRLVSKRLSAIIPFLRIEPGKDEDFFLRIERVPTAEQEARLHANIT